MKSLPYLFILACIIWSSVFLLLTGSSLAKAILILSSVVGLYVFVRHLILEYCNNCYIDNTP